MIGKLGLRGAYHQHVRYWLPGLGAGGIAWLAFMLIGHTPVIRASGLALVIIGMAFLLRPMGAALAIIGALALAFSPSFWIQTGGAESLNGWAVAAGLAGAVGLAIAVFWLSKRPMIGASVGLLLFAGLFLLVIGQPRSLRLTTLTTAWTLALLFDGLLLSNPRPDSPPTGQLGPQHTYGLLLLLAIGVFNDPLFVLLAPAIVLALFLSNKALPVWYWALLVVIIGVGIRGMILLYANTDWWGYDAELAEMQGLQVPYLIAGGWREPSRWLKLMDIVIGQFSVVGLALGVLGLARLARWYPPIGVVTMIAYGTFALFGLVYFGGDSSVLLLPLLMIQVLWMTYAVYTFSQWLQKSLHSDGMIRWAAPAAFTLLPLAMLLKIVGAI